MHQFLYRRSRTWKMRPLRGVILSRLRPHENRPFDPQLLEIQVPPPGKQEDQAQGPPPLLGLPRLQRRPPEGRHVDPRPRPGERRTGRWRPRPGSPPVLHWHSGRRGLLPLFPTSLPLGRRRAAARVERQLRALRLPRQPNRRCVRRGLCGVHSLRCGGGYGSQEHNRHTQQVLHDPQDHQYLRFLYNP